MEVIKNDIILTRKETYKLKMLQQALTTASNEVNTHGVTKQRLEFLIAKIRTQWTAVSNVHEEVVIYGVATSISDEELEALEQRTEKTIERIQHQLEVYNTRMKISMPTLTLPTFAGTRESWTTFDDLFKKIIHDNQTLSNAEKMHFLKTHLTGEASRVIQHLMISEANYETAYALLRKRYDNKRLLVAELVDTILDLPVSKRESASHLKAVHDTTLECIDAIANLGIETTSWSPIIQRLLARTWDPDTIKLYEQNLDDPSEVQSLQSVMDFMFNRFQSLEAVARQQRTSTTEDASPGRVSRVKCKFCDGDHSIYTCPEFLKLRPDQRGNAIMQRSLCRKCLQHEQKSPCYTKYKCRICNREHHTLLHKDSPGEPRQFSRVTSNHAELQSETVLLATALIKTATARGTMELLRILIDSGSQASFITEHAAQLIGLPREGVRASVSGIGTNGTQSTSKVVARLSPRFPSQYSLETTLLVLPKLTDKLPSQPLDTIDNAEWTNIVIADPTYKTPGPIDIILGAHDLGRIIKAGLLKSSDGVIAQQTEFGWIFSGSIKQAPTVPIEVTSLVGRAEEDNMLARFWELEEVNNDRTPSPKEKICENFYTTTTVRRPDGAYTVRLPLQELPKVLGNSRTRATARLLQLENRFTRDEKLRVEYIKFMTEYRDLGHMKKIHTNQARYYIPHQAVIKEDSSTTKLRVVFDASSKTSSGSSLNDIMLAGPRLQQDLSDILLRWRVHKIAYSADIEKMYRQIHVHPDDQQLQTILWRFNPEDEIDTYALTTVTYGTSSAPYLAIRTLRQLAIDEIANYPEECKVLLRDFYVDDVLSGADNIEDAIRLQTRLCTLLSSGGFTLRKWSSNSPQLLSSIPEHLQDQATIEITEDTVKKSLGLYWRPEEDSFHFKFTKVSTTKITKRFILSEVSKLFDPLGWLQPIIVSAKMMIQQLWLSKLNWDEQVPAATIEWWHTFQSQLLHISVLRIPRWIQYTQGSVLEYHGFCDASEKAYGAVVYCIVTNPDTGMKKTSIVTAKSKIAPAPRVVTLARLELCSAVLLAKLMAKVLKASSIEDTPYHCWSDSMIALGWIRGEPCRWKTFVANRVSTIQTITSIERWNHVKGHDNPADFVSRGVEPATLYTNDLWWRGPAWLSDTSTWPHQELIQYPVIEVKCLSACATEASWDPTARFSSWTRLLRVYSYCYRFISACKHQPRQEGRLMIYELEETLLRIIRHVQNKEYKLEIDHLSNGLPLLRSSRLLNLAPFLDGGQILRVGGRLQLSTLPYNERHPIIIPTGHHIAKLLIRASHHQTLHGGRTLTLAHLRQQFWIPAAKKAISYEINRCVTCIRYKGQPLDQHMGQLPVARVTPSPPFTHTGVDYAGPIQVRCSKGRGQKSTKGYIAVFVCLSTKAIHLEAVGDLSSETFLAAFRRFVARRGHCAHLYSDNGTAFVGADNLLRKAEPLIDAARTQWHFIPPSAPHFGGLWEAGVKSTKHHLRRVLGDSTLTFEELSTLLCQIESCLNSRPLIPLSDADISQPMLTPGHFLIGRPTLEQSLAVDFNEDVSTLVRWRYTQKMKRDFWNAWSRDYLQELQRRYKWQQCKDNINVGEVGILKDETVTPSKWPLVRVSAVHPSGDKTVRVVTVNTASGQSYKRPITKIIPLPVAEAPVRTSSPTNDVSANVGRVNYGVCIFLGLLLSSLTPCTGAISTTKYRIEYPKPGLYVEHLGEGRIERGTFRIDVQLDKPRIAQDLSEASLVVDDMEHLCTEAEKTYAEVYCAPLVQQLRERQDHLQWIEAGLRELIRTRAPRGLLGKLLTSVFGVNDEVYEDIDRLDQNQQEVLKTMNHQSKFMLSALSDFNNTETRIAAQLEQFRLKLNEGIAAISAMQGFFARVDQNQVRIHLLTTYELGSTFISTMIDHYTKMQNIHFHKAYFYDVVSPNLIHKRIQESTRKLPSHLRILEHPILKTEVDHDTDKIHLYGYFVLVETTTFQILKPTPIPIKIENGHHWSFDISNNLIAVNYDVQQYFEISDDDLSRNLRVHPTSYVCSPSVVQTIGASSNCVLDELYELQEHACRIQTYPTPAVTWKQLYMSNTWLFLAENTTKIAITCDGTREDAVISGAGLIQLSPGCVIQTKRNIITARREEIVSTMGGFIKPTKYTLTQGETTRAEYVQLRKFEEVFKKTDSLNTLHTKEQRLADEIHGFNWRRTIHHVSILTSCGTTISIITVVLGVACGVRVYIQRRRQGTTNHQPTEGAIQLEPLYSSPDGMDPSRQHRPISERPENV